jgi:hypothetical protein
MSATTERHPSPSVGRSPRSTAEFDPMVSPFFHAAVEESRVITRGMPSCLLGYRVSGRDGLDSDGIFAEWHWDGERLIVRNDRYGLYPLYYFQKGNANGEFHSATIRRSYPNYADLPFEDKRAAPVDARAHDAQFIRDLTRCMLGRIRQSRGLMRGRYVLPRMVYGLVNQRYAETTAWVAPLILYLFQLETIASGDPSWNGRVS